MNLLSKVQQMFGFRSTEAPTIVDEAIQKSRSVSGKADRVNEVLDGYLHTAEPFKAFATDIFERDQESRIHHGPLR